MARKPVRRRVPTRSGVDWQMRGFLLLSWLPLVAMVPASQPLHTGLLIAAAVGLFVWRRGALLRSRASLNEPVVLAVAVLVGVGDLTPEPSLAAVMFTLAGGLGAFATRMPLAALIAAMVAMNAVVHTVSLSLSQAIAGCTGTVLGFAGMSVLLAAPVHGGRVRSTLEAILQRAASPAAASGDGTVKPIVQDALREVQTTVRHTLDMTLHSMECSSAIVMWFDAHDGPATIAHAIGCTAGTRQVNPRAGILAMLRRRPAPLRYSGVSIRPELLPWYTESALPSSVMGIGLVNDGIPLGAFVVGRDNDRPFDDNDALTLQAAGELIVGTFRSEQSVTELRRIAEEMQAIRRAVETLYKALTATDVCAAGARIFADQLDLDYFVVLRLLESDAQEVVFRLNERAGLQPGFRVPLYEQSLVALAAKSQQQLPLRGRVDDPAEVYGDPGYMPELESVLVVPILIGGRCIGTCVFGSLTRDAFPLARRAFIDTVVANMAGSLANAVAYDQAVVAATTDGMTGLLNHRTFKLRAAEALLRAERGQRVACLLLTDIDFFKKVNDTHGHATGDVVIKAVAEVLRNTLRKTDLGARYGGEEFGIFLEETEQKQAFALAERIRNTVAQLEFDGVNGPFSVTLSLGIAEFPTHASELADLIEFADQALYGAKRGGRNQAVIYPPKEASKGPRAS